MRIVEISHHAIRYQRRPGFAEINSWMESLKQPQKYPKDSLLCASNTINTFLNTFYIA